MKLSRNAKRAIKKYGEYECLRCFRMHDRHGEGARTVALYAGLPNTNAADAAINAGRELAKGAV